MSSDVGPLPVPCGLIKVWYSTIGTAFAGTNNWRVLGGFLRCWLGGSSATVFASQTCKRLAFTVFPICPCCGKMWRFRGWWNHAPYLELGVLKIQRANVCLTCYQSRYIYNDQKRLCEFWSTQCKRCGVEYHDVLMHDQRACEKLIWIDSSEPSELSDEENEQSDDSEGSETLIHSQNDSQLLGWNVRVMDHPRPLSLARCCVCWRQLGDPSVRAYRCSRCKMALFCGVSCQKRHWSQHRAFCKTFALKIDASSSSGR